MKPLMVFVSTNSLMTSSIASFSPIPGESIITRPHCKSKSKEQLAMIVCRHQIKSKIVIPQNKAKPAGMRVQNDTNH